MTNADGSTKVRDVPPTNNTATISLVAGILGLTLLPFAASIVAIVTGYIARREIRASAGALGGADLATAGLVLGWIGVGLGVIGICVIGVILVLPFCLFFPFVRGEIGALLPLMCFL